MTHSPKLGRIGSLLGSLLGALPSSLSGSLLGPSLRRTCMFVLIGFSAGAYADVYRCVGTNGSGTEYINNVKEAQQRGCKTMQGGSVTVVQATSVVKSAPVRVASTSPGSNAGSGSSGSGSGSNSADQKVRDSDSRSILESELKKAEAKLAEQQKDFNNGEPEKQGIEGRNYQRYLDRVAEMKDSIARNVSDIAGLKREISRLPSNN